MIDLLKEDLEKQPGTIKISLTTGKEEEGTVVSFGTNYILLKTNDGREIRIFDKIIGAWELMGSPLNQSQVGKIETTDKVSPTVSEIQTPPIASQKITINLSNYLGYFNQIDKNDFPFTRLDLDFYFGKGDDKDSSIVNKELLKLKNKYDNALKIKEMNRLKDILSSLNLLLKNYSYNKYIYYNIGLIYYRLEKYEDCIRILNEAVNTHKDSQLFHLLSLSNYKLKQSKKLLQSLLNCIIVKNSVDKEDPHFISLIQASKLLKDFFPFVVIVNTIPLNKKNSNSILEAVLYFFYKENFEKEKIDLLLQQLEQGTLDRELVIRLIKELPYNVSEDFIKDFNFYNENNKILPPNAVIHTYFPDRFYGFVSYSDDKEAFFHISNIIDDTLSERLKKQIIIKTYIPVVCSFNPSERGNIAVCLQYPREVYKVIEDVHRFYSLKEYTISGKLIQQILFAYPDNMTAQALQGKYKEIKYGSNKSGLYSIAKKAHEEKRYDEAIRFYKECIERGEKIESSLKDLAQCYTATGEKERAIDLIESNLSFFQDKHSAYNLLATLYLHSKQFVKAESYLVKNLKNNPNSISLWKQLTYCYINLYQLDNARESIDKILKLNPNDNLALRWQELLSNPDVLKKDPLSSDPDSFNFSAVSAILKYDLEYKCNYEGLPDKAIESKNFTNQMLVNLRSLIEEKGRGTFKQRAKWLLTEAKLVSEYNLDSEDKLIPILSKYCIAMGQAYHSEQNYEMMRSYYFESFKLLESLHQNVRQLIIFIISFSIRLFEKYNYSFGSDTKVLIEQELEVVLLNVVKSLTNENARLSFWNSILEIAIYNVKIKEQLFLLLKRNQFLKEDFIGRLFKDKKESVEQIDDNFFEEKRRELKKEIDDWFVKIYSIENCSTLISSIDQLDRVWSELIPQWLPDIEKKRYKNIEDITNDIRDYIKLKSFYDSEKNYYFIKTKISQLILEIKEKPSRYSFEGYLRLLEHLNKSLEDSFKEILDSSKPKIELKIAKDSTPYNEKNNLTSVHISLSNEKGCSPISDIEILIQNTEHYKCIGNPEASGESLKGGEERIFKVTLWLSDTVIQLKATSIKIICRYRTRLEEKEKEEKIEELTLKLYSSDEFEKIYNPYASLADSGPVKNKEMFYGRDEFIEFIKESIINSKSKSIVIYGQKRSGKSSVLHHLKEKLNETGKAFCVSFSLGEDSGEEITINTFYYRILTNISDALFDLKSLGQLVPNFSGISYSELKENPSVIFDEKLKEFKRESYQLKEWKDKLLVLLIDEFTYLYTNILKKNISPEIMKKWKSLIEKDAFSVVLVGQDVMPRFKNQFPNEFGVTEDKRLTYLRIGDAIKLIEEPIWDKKRNCSRYVGKAIDKILEYTSTNPYYIQIFCARQVDYMNQNRSISVTEADIQEVAESFISGSQSLSEDKFNNLITSGDADIETFPVEDTLEVLKQIANGSKNLGRCSREYIRIKDDEDYTNKILKDLTDREVLKYEDGYYKIQVRLFQEWLLKH